MIFKKLKLKTFSSWMNKSTFTLGDKVVKLREKRQLFVISHTYLAIPDSKWWEIQEVLASWLCSINDEWYIWDFLYMEKVVEEVNGNEIIKEKKWNCLAWIKPKYLLGNSGSLLASNLFANKHTFPTYSHIGWRFNPVEEISFELYILYFV